MPISVKLLPLAAVAAGGAILFTWWRRRSLRLSSLPKVELHVHLDGAFDVSILFAIARRRLAANELPPAIAEPVAGCGDSIDTFIKLATCGPEDQTLQAMLDRFMFFLPIVQGDMHGIEELAQRFVATQAAQNVIYTEVRYSPHILTAAASYVGENAAALDDDAAMIVVDAVTRGLRRGCAEHPGTEVAQILCFIDGKPEWALNLAKLAATLHDPRSLDVDPARALAACPVVGIDIAAGESHFLRESGQNGIVHRKTMCQCSAIGLGLTNHAGESGPASHVMAAASSAYGSATRVGHGYAAVLEAQAALCEPGQGSEDPSARALLGALRGLGVPDGMTLEMCPTSSWCTRGWAGTEWRQHPAALLTRLRRAAEAAGDTELSMLLPQVTISSDDPSVFGSSITQECGIAVEGMGFSEGDLKVVMRNAVAASFLPPRARSRLADRLEAAWT